MQRQTTQTLTFGQKPLPLSVKLGLVLLRVAVLTGVALVLTGVLRWEQLFPEPRGVRSHQSGSPVIWFACLAVVVPAYLLTRRQLILEIGANEEHIKAESLRAAPGTWIGLGLLLAAAVGFTWLVVSSLGGSPR